MRDMFLPATSQFLRSHIFRGRDTSYFHFNGNPNNALRRAHHLAVKTASSMVVAVYDATFLERYFDNSLDRAYPIMHNPAHLKQLRAAYRDSEGELELFIDAYCLPSEGFLDLLPTWRSEIEQAKQHHYWMRNQQARAKTSTST